MKKDSAVCVLLLPTKHVDHGSSTVGRGSLFDRVTDALSAVVFICIKPMNTAQHTLYFEML